MEAPFGDGEAGEVGFQLHTQTSSSRSEGNPFQSVNKNDFSVAPPKNEDFGIQAVNANGHTGNIEGECEDNCNFRGICDAGVCYCQMGFYGKLCGHKATGSDDSVSLMRTSLVCGAAFAVAFVLMSILLMVHQHGKKKREAQIGYDV